MTSYIDSFTLFDQNLKDMTIEIGTFSAKKVNVYGADSSYTESVEKKYI